MRIFLLLLFFGLIFSSFAGSRVIFEEKEPSDTISLDSTRLVTIGEILISGNNKTKNEIILRELQLRNGDTVRIWRLNEILKKDRNKVYNTRLFNSATVISTIREKAIADIHVTVEERWYFFPVAILDLADPNFNIWWRQRNHDLNRLEYGIRLTQKNVRGMNEEARVTIQVGFTKRFELMYNMPYIDQKKKNGLRFSGSYSTNKNISYKTTDHVLQPLNSEYKLRERFKGGVKPMRWKVITILFRSMTPLPN
jgi:outer membrane protein assembly factor BamA